MTEAPDPDKFPNLPKRIPDRGNRGRKPVVPKNFRPPTEGDGLTKMNEDGTYPDAQEAEE